MTSTLFSPIEVGGLTLPNRLWIAPMCQYSVEDEDGVPTEWHLVHLGSLARGGAGLVFTEATAVSPEGRISPQDTGIWNEQQAAAWSRIIDFAHGLGTATGVQLAHAGRKASTYSPFAGASGTVPVGEGGWRTVAPSAVAFPGYDEPDALDADGLAKVVEDFAAAARRAVEAGFDVLELHAAHGYLLHQFLSPLSNQRTDAYGGSLENRARLLLEVVAAVRAAAPSTPLYVRFSATDWREDGWTVEETATVAGWARDAGADFFDISSGGNGPAEIPVGPGYQVPLAEEVKRLAGVPVSAVGLITEAEQAEEIVASGRADAVMIARASLRNPHFPLAAAEDLGADAPWPPQYVRAARRRSRAAGQR
ncbi:MAG TPA: NADH:flavin oxidoreductase/NADH oxidase [Amnibacterium sp.]|jgi:2,4-dienoyl-CoA reductase-like NADH-dependent reductase (Old Yellow Enzyme family)|uniref:NADH:flavin oxidoreductase/NADH oxidase n=1 Tax=Amnibacterium sp. TaxID=1872496 RepID=UPI002F9256CD